jgi:DNA-nicking Smr family endonuclease
MTARRRRGLTEEDAALWAEVTETVAPLKRRRRARKRAPPPEAGAEPEPAAAPLRPATAAAGTTPSAPKSVPRRPAIPPLAPIDRQERRRVVRGTRALEGRIDLHGMRQSEAHEALRGFLSSAQARGQKVVLVITGKGAPAGPAHGLGEERGVLRRLVPLWLGMADLRPIVLGFEEAHPGHGGGGALYVHLRRAKRRSVSP